MLLPVSISLQLWKMFAFPSSGNICIDMYAEYDQEFCIVNMHTQSGADSHDSRTTISPCWSLMSSGIAASVCFCCANSLLEVMLHVLLGIWLQLYCLDFRVYHLWHDWLILHVSLPGKVTCYETCMWVSCVLMFVGHHGSDLQQCIYLLFGWEGAKPACNNCDPTMQHQMEL